MLTLNATQLAFLASLGVNLNTAFGEGVGDGGTLTYQPQLGYDESKHAKIGQYLKDFSPEVRLPFIDTIAALLPLLGVGTTPSWTTITLDAPWTNFGGLYPTAAYYVDAFGTVHLRGAIVGGIENQTIATLPLAVRPTNNQLMATNGIIGGVSVATVLNVLTTGVFKTTPLPAGTFTFLSIDNLTYQLR